VKEDREKFIAAMDDDFNTPLAISALFEIAKKANQHLMEPEPKKEVVAAMQKELIELGGVLNLYRAAAKGGLSDEEIDGLVNERQAARKAKDFKRSDELRAKLKELGIILEDQKDGTVRWKRAR
jgi:cysteinyl-tRNA synthetase